MPANAISQAATYLQSVCHMPQQAAICLHSSKLNVRWTCLFYFYACSFFSNFKQMSTTTPVVAEFNNDGKVTAITIHGHRVSSMDIFSTLNRIATFCKQPVQQLVTKWGSNPDVPFQSDKQFLQTAAFVASLFVQKYLPTASWEMDDEPALWEVAILEIARHSPAEFNVQVA